MNVVAPGITLEDYESGRAKPIDLFENQIKDWILRFALCLAHEHERREDAGIAALLLSSAVLEPLGGVLPMAKGRKNSEAKFCNGFVRVFGTIPGAEDTWQIAGRVADTTAPGKITWEDVGTTAPAGSPTSVPQWAPNTLYVAGQVIADADNGHFYLARTSGQSGAAAPVFPITVRDLEHGMAPDGNTIWMDSGTAAPAAVATAGPTDASVSLVNMNLPQVHSLYYFNIATGFGVSGARNSTFTTVAQTNASGTTYLAQQTRGHRIVEPIILLTAYLPGLPMDAESPWKPRNLIPGLSFGFSMSNPANSFYLGGSSEIWRNLQLAYGVNINTGINTLVPNQTFTALTQAPATTSRTTIKPFIGLTLNLDFIASFFNQKF